MKHYIFNFLTGIALLLILAGATSCTKDEGSSTTPGGNQPKEVFNFSTRAAYTLNLNYDVPTGYSVYFEVYAENPFTTDENGLQAKRADVQPVDKGFTDEKGGYSKPILLNSAVETR